MWRRVALSMFCATIYAVGTSCLVSALDVPSAPTIDRPIVDTTGTLSKSQIDDLSSQIAKSRSEKSFQIGILMIPSLDGAVLESYSLDVARKWGIGDATNNGALLLVVKNDRKMRIEVGRGLEGDLTDTRAAKIIQNSIAPKFRDGDYYGGISDGVNSIQLAVSKQADPKLNDTSSAIGSLFDAIPAILFGVFFVFSWLSSILARTKSWWAGGVIGGIIGSIAIFASSAHPLAIGLLITLVPLGLVVDYFVSRNYHKSVLNGTSPAWWAGGTHIGGGGFRGGGGSFGGGGFSGGGSSGSW